MFDLRSLEGVFIVFAGPCLVNSFGRTSLAWASLGFILVVRGSTLSKNKLVKKTKKPKESLKFPTTM
jgi:hypothetical protein